MNEPRIEIEGEVVYLKVGLPTTHVDLLALRLKPKEGSGSHGYDYRRLAPNGDLIAVEFESNNCYIEGRQFRGHAGLMRAQLQETASPSLISDWMRVILHTHHLRLNIDLVIDVIRSASEADAKRLIECVCREYMGNTRMDDWIFSRAYLLPDTGREFIFTIFTDESTYRDYLRGRIVNNYLPMEVEEVTFIRQVIERVRTRDLLLELRSAVHEKSLLLPSIDVRLSALALNLSDGQTSATPS